MFDTVCTLPLESDLFAQAIHPTASLITVGLTSGHVAALRLPPADEDPSNDDNDSPPNSHASRRGSNGTGFIDTAWRTRRHKGSCRCLAYSLDGLTLYSGGSDGIVKAADSETGRVTGKAGIPRHEVGMRTDPVDAPTVIHALSPQTLLLGTDAGALHLYDLRDPAPSLPVNGASLSSATGTAFVASPPSRTYRPHQDGVLSLAPLPASATSTSGYGKQWLTTGGTALALTDLRRGVLAVSGRQDELLLSSTYVTGLPVRKSSGASGEKAVVGGGNGALTLWEKGQWASHDERIVVSRERETLDCLAVVPDGVGGLGTRVAVGVGDGSVRVVRLGVNKVVAEVRHDEIEGVVALGFDASGRMVSGGGQTIKVWQEHIEAEEEEDGEDEEGAGVTKRAAGSEEDSDEDEDEGDDSSEEEAAPRQRRKKRRKGKGPTNGQAKKFDFGGLD